MKKEMSAFALVLAAVLLFVYLFNLSPTGFVVQTGTSNFASAPNNSFVNTTYSNSAITLSGNATAGYYLSDILGNGTNYSWNNMTWTGAVPGNSSLSFQVTTCSDANCSDANFADATSTNNTIDFSSMNLTSQYFQYKVLFSRDNLSITSPSLTSVSYAYSSIAAQNETNETQNQTNSTNESSVSVSITDPAGNLDYKTDISVDYTITGGTNLTCWYSVTSGSNTVISDTNLANCGSSNFNVDSDGNYVFHLYVNGSEGLVEKTSDFAVDTSSQQTQQQQNTTQQQTQNTTQQTQTPVVPPQVTKLTASNIPETSIVQGDLKNMTFSVQNSGTTSLSGCALKITGKYASWFKVLDKSKNLSPGGKTDFAFSASVPLDASVGSYLSTASVKCAQTSASKDFKIDVQQKKLNISILSTRRNKLDNVQVSYELADLTGKDQNVSVEFQILDANNTEIGNASDTQTLAANATKDFSLNVPINSSAEGNMSLSGTFGSEKFSATVLEPILLGAPVSGLAIGPLGTGSLAVVLGVIIVFVVLFFGVRRMRKKARKRSSSRSEKSSVGEEH